VRGAGRGCPPRLPILALRAPRQPQRPPDRPRARAEAAGVAAEGIPSPRRVRGRIRCGRGAAGGAATGEPPQLPRAPAAHGGTCRPTARAWSEDREPGAAPPPPARTLPSLRRRAARADRLSARRGEGMPPAAPDPRLTRAASVATSPRGPRARAEAAGVAAEGIPSPRRVRGRIRCGRRAAGAPRPATPAAPARACGSRGDAPADGARVERGSGAGAAPPPPARTAPSSGYRFAAESFSQSLAAIVSSGPNRAARASWSSAALPTTTIATASGGGMSFAATSAACSGVTAATRSR